MLLGPPYSARFDEVCVGLSIPRRATAEAGWGPSAGGERREGRMTLYGIGTEPGVLLEVLLGKAALSGIGKLL